MAIDYVKRLNKAQMEAVSSTEGPVLMLAAAGTGKTRTLIHRVAYLVEHGVPACSILLLTFTNKAAGEMKERADKLLGGRGGGLTACTYHSFCAKILRQHAQEAGIDPAFTIITGSDITEAINMVKADYRMNELRGFPKTSQAAQLFSKMVNLDKPMEQVIDGMGYKAKKQMLRFLNELKAIRAGYGAYKQQNNLMDYDDLLIRSRDMLRDAPSVREKVSAAYAYIMVDEYQDTNKIQDEILFLLRRDNHNLAVVGDDSQSLYAFRGADVKNIIGFPKKAKGCKTVEIMDNYRSCQEILDVANFAIKNYATEGYQKTVVGQYRSGDLPKEVHVASNEEESEFVVSEVKERLAQGCAPQEICILSRNSMQSAPIEVLLNKGKIPYVKYGGLKFLEKEDIKDILCFLRVLTNSADEIAWFRILKLIYGIGDIHAREIANGCKACGMDWLVGLQHASKMYYDGLCSLHSCLEAAGKLCFSERLNSICTFYINLLKENTRVMRVKDESSRTAAFMAIEMMEKDIMTLKDIAKGFDDTMKFLDSLALDEKTPEEKDGCIVLSTIHSAKGLEFDTVFVLACADGVFPRTDDGDRGTKEDNEELRCFYVAVTRAKKHLYLMVPEHYQLYGRVSRCQPSHYFRKAKGLLEKIQA